MISQSGINTATQKAGENTNEEKQTITTGSECVQQLKNNEVLPVLHAVMGHWPACGTWSLPYTLHAVFVWGLHFPEAAGIRRGALQIVGGYFCTSLYTVFPGKSDAFCL